MKLTINLAAALPTLKTAARIAPPTFPGARIHAPAGQPATITTTDLQTTITLPINADTQQPGTIIAPARLLADTLNRLAGTIQLCADTRSITITAGQTVITLNALHEQNWPTHTTGDNPVTIPGALHHAARIAGFAAADQTRPVLTAVQITATGDGQMRLIATDSYRMAIITAPLRPPTPAATALIPATAIRLAHRATNGDDTCDVTIGSRGATITLPDGGTIATTLIGDLTPTSRYLDLIPPDSEFTRQIIVDRGELLSAIRRVQPLATRNQPLVIQQQDDALTVSVSSTDGEASSTLDCDATGNPIRIGVNPMFLADTLAALDSDEARIRLIAATRPILVDNPVASSDSRLRALLMPIRLPA